ncbi:MAG TPA: hypothetical protein VFK07_01130, partial [Candidatus Paceibacterota bacterium]|nr:hypothetical protein [Candidatus Paceibacterota bacterium]
PPILLFFFGIREFINVISLAGGVSIGLEQIMIIFMYAKAKTHGDRLPEYSLNIHPWLLYPIMTILSAGIVYFIILR